MEEQGVDATQVNEFDCGAVHWIGICPQSQCTDDTGADLLPLAVWLAKQPGIDFYKRQRQGHTPMHKVSALLNGLDLILVFTLYGTLDE